LQNKSRFARYHYLRDSGLTIFALSTPNFEELAYVHPRYIAAKDTSRTEAAPDTFSFKLWPAFTILHRDQRYRNSRIFEAVTGMERKSCLMQSLEKKQLRSADKLLGTITLFCFCFSALQKNSQKLCL
jgi:hypothetical protein